MSTKKWLIRALSMIALGAMLTAFSSCSSDKVGFLFSDYETASFDVSDNFDDISIEVDTADVNFLVSEDDKCHVVSYTQKNINCSVMVEDNVLKISTQDDRAWYEYIHIGVEKSSLCIYLPKSEYSALTLNGSTGDIMLSQNFKFESIDIAISSGDLNISASADGAVKLKARTGDISLSDMSAESIAITVSTGDITVKDVACDGDISLKSTTGKSNLKNITCNNLSSNASTGDIEMENVISGGKITMKRGSGDVSMYACDAGELDIATSTGNVKGVLLTPKIFITRASTGDIDVPETTTGGICKVNTSTGDIVFTIAESEG